MIGYPVTSLVLALCAIGAGAQSASGSTFRVVVNLPAQCKSPGSLSEGSRGLFFSQAAALAAFSVTVTGTVTTLASVQQPPYQMVGIPIPAANGLEYASIEQFSSGNVFSVTSKPGSEHIYPAQSPFVAPILGDLPDAQLFGLAYDQPTATYSIATVNLVGKVTPFYQFPSGETPGPPVYHADGSYYGLSNPHDSTAYLYRLSPSGSLTKIATLPFFTTGIEGGDGVLVQATDGNFYGIQSSGLGCAPANQHGAIFKLTPSGQYTVLHDFGPCEMATSLIEGSDGRLWGTTYGSSVLFSLTTSGTYKAEFGINGDGGLCPCYLLQGSDGQIYGTALGGGPAGYGLVFAFDAGLPVPKPQAGAFAPSSGVAGTRVRIWGYNLFGASVEFNGVPAPGAVNSGPNYIWVTVPAGATTGPITATTPGGAVTTRESFTVN